MDLDERALTITKGVWAKHLIEDPSWIKFLEELAHQQYLAWGYTQSEDTAQREAIYMTRKGVQMVTNALQARVENLKVEEKKIADER